MARTVVYRRPGKPSEVLEVVEADPPSEVSSEQILIRVTAFPIHPGDLQAIEASTFPAAVTATPQSAGIEATGVVVAVGAGVTTTGVRKGARVTVFPQPGAWSEYLVADAQFVVPVPDELSDDVAAQMLVNPLTVNMLRREVETTRAIGYNGVFLQTAAGSSIGRLMTAGAEHHRMALINLVRSSDGAAALHKRFPNTPVLSTSEPAWQDEVRRLAEGRPITAAIDPIGGALAGELLALLAPGGTLVSYGRMAAEPMPLHASILLNSALVMRGATIGRWVATTSPEQRAWDVATAVAMARAHSDLFDVAAHYDITELATAVEHAVRPGKVGTVLVAFN